MNLFLGKFKIEFKKIFGDYFFLLLLLTGIAVNYYFEMKVNRAIKKFTADHEILQERRANAEQVFILAKQVTDFENSVRAYQANPDSLLRNAINSSATDLNRSIVLVTEQMRNVAAPADVLSLRRIFQQKLAFTHSLADMPGQLNPLVLQESLALSRTMSAQCEKVYQTAQAEITKRNAQLTEDRMAIISLDYAMPHLISFIFLVIAAFILYKILQVSKLNKNLQDAIAKEQKAQLVKDQFMDNMTHELRSPLNSVLGYTNLLLKTPLNSDQSKFVKSIRTSGELLLNVINEELDFSKVKSGYIHFSNDPFSFNGQMNALSDIVRDKVIEKGLQFECIVDSEIPDTLRGDSGKLLQVLLNLTSNAIKFTSEGRITVKATCREKAQDRITIAISVADTGMGIPPDKLPHIFERFFQVEAAGKAHTGTGLGLSITREMVALQGGQIAVESEPGKGTCFNLEIPYDIHREADGEEGEGLGDEQSRLQLPYSMKVLVVDDNTMNRELVSFILRDFGVKYTLVPGGHEALSLLAREQFDVVLMDLQMPGMDGKETTRRLREDLGSEVPVVALSAYAQAQEKQKCLEAGMDAYLTKPVNEKDLYETLEMYAPAAAPVTVDMEYLRKIANGNTEYIETVILKVADQLPRDIEELRNALYENDHQKVNTLSHDMKTTFAVLGVTPAVAESLRFLESWKPDQNNILKAGKMLEIVESVGAEVTFQILDAFADPDTTPDDQQVA